MITYDQVKNDPEVHTLIKKADDVLTAIGYTEHCFAHVDKVAHTAYNILSTLGFGERECENAKIAGYLHDIGNMINREDHAHSGGMLAFSILTRMNCDIEDKADIVTAIGHHDERTAFPVSNISAALILADKTDVRANRVRNVTDVSSFDIHDRVNYSVKSSQIFVDAQSREIKLSLAIDTSLCPVIDYFEIYSARMILCRKAAQRLNASFKLIINEQQLI